MNDLANALPARTQMQNYWIQRPLRVSKTAIVYLAEDMRRNRKVFLTEFFPLPIAKREYREDGSFFLETAAEHHDEFNEKMACFLAEAEAFMPLEHPNIVKVIRCFESNGTAYAAAEYEEGCDLPSYLAAHGGRLGEAEIKAVVLPLFKALTLLKHRNIPYDAINTANIYRYKNGSGALMGCVNCLSASRLSQHGEYRDNIYALGALMYKLITGSRPLDEVRREYSTSKGEADPYAPLKAGEDASKIFCDAVNFSLSMDISKRPKSIMELQMLLGENALPPETPAVAQKKAEAPLTAVRLLGRVFYYASLSVVAGSLFYLFLYRSAELELAQVNDFDIARYHLAANLGNSEAQRALGDIYAHPAGDNHNDKEAFGWYLKAAGQEDMEAQLHLGTFFEKGRGTVQSYEKAALWYEKAAEKKSAQAQYNLGLLYEKGLGVEKDESGAAVLYQKAAVKGHKQAQARLAEMAANANGVEKDHSRAIDW